MKLDKLRKKYGYTGASYQELISKILHENALNINNHVISLDDTYYKDVAKRFNKKSTKRFVVPDISNEMYDSTIQIRKSAEKGKLISDTLKDQLRENLREVFDIKTGKTGQSKVIVQTGKKASTINQSMINLYEQKITETFTNYLKDTNEKTPANIKTIATTEVRSAVHDIQHHYVGELVRRNPSLKIMKKWIHNPNLSKIKPRDNHEELGRLKPIPYNENWIFISQSGKTVSASRPHDPSLPPEEVIGCHCDIEYQGVYTMDKSKELNEVRKTLINMNIVAKGRKGYDVGTIVDRKDGKWKKTGEGQWEKVRDEEQSLEGDDKELDAMIDEKGKMSEEMNKPDIDETADKVMELIDAGYITQDELDNLSPEEIELMYEELLHADEDAEEYGGDKLSPEDIKDFEDADSDYDSDVNGYSDEYREKILNEQGDIIREDLVANYVENGMDEDEAWDMVNDMKNVDLFDAIGGDEGLADYDLEDVDSDNEIDEENMSAEDKFQMLIEDCRDDPEGMHEFYLDSLKEQVSKMSDDELMEAVYGEGWQDDPDIEKPDTREEMENDFMQMVSEDWWDMSNEERAREIDPDLANEVYGKSNESSKPADDFDKEFDEDDEDEITRQYNKDISKINRLLDTPMSPVRRDKLQAQRDKLQQELDDFKKGESEVYNDESYKQDLHNMTVNDVLDTVDENDPDGFAVGDDWINHRVKALEDAGIPVPSEFEEQGDMEALERAYRGIESKKKR